MSRRPPTGADRTEQNRATLKQLVKLEANKTCADCKRNKHPRWASWNLGIFICIRCSGIHRGMGTHISRVKSVDLDSWTDEQMQSMLRWGNARANKYWEHKLAEGHVPNEAKIENFIRTKYDSKRWAMDGPIPDPSTLDTDEADDNIPLNVVQEKAKAEIQRTGSLRNGNTGIPAPQPPRPRPQQIDLFGDTSEAAPAPPRPSTTEPAGSRSVPLKGPAAPPKHNRPSDSLLGFDFLSGSSSTGLARPASTGPGTPSAAGRSDLKQSILSLYASKPAAPPAQPASNAFSGMQSPSLASPAQSQSNALGDLGDAFGSLSFGSSNQQPQPKPAPFSNFAAPAAHSRQTSINKPLLSGGGFFDAKPAPPPKPASPKFQPAATTRPASNSFGADWGDFSSAPAPAPAPAASNKSPPPVTSSMGDLFDMSSPASAPVPVPAPPATSSAFSATKTNYATNAFNLSQPTPAPPKPAAPAQTSTMSNFSSMSSADAWGSSDAWATPDPPTAPAPAPAPTPITTSAPKFKTTPAPAVTTTFDSGWGDPEPSTSTNTSNASGFTVQQDEEFGGWSHASPIATTPGPKQGGGGGLSGNSDDLFGNVWE